MPTFTGDSMSIQPPIGFSRRRFLRTTAGVGLGLAFAEKIIADPFKPLDTAPKRRAFYTVRGSVTARGKALAGVVVSDGLSVVPTDRDGSFSFPADTKSRFVFLSLPSGYDVPVSSLGTASFFKELPRQGAGDVTVRWDLTPSASKDDRHGFLLLADPQTLDADDMAQFNADTIPDVIQTRQDLGSLPLFGVSCGDIMFDRLELFPEYERAVQRTGIPFFQVLGNHDVDGIARTDEASAETFVRHFGPANYSFNKGEVHYVVLDDVLWLGHGYIGYLGQDQLDWLQGDLSYVEKGKTVIVFMHIPSYCSQHVREGRDRPEQSLVVVNRDILTRMLEPYRTHIIVGHMHESEHLTDGGAHVHVCGAVCGAWWTGPVCGDGTPKGYGIYEIAGSDVRWRYKSTGYAIDHQVSVYPVGIDPGAPDSIVANVWDYDPSWSVVWYEDGERKGKMEMRRGQDPQAVKLYSGGQLPSKHQWVEPYITDHLFVARPSGPGKKIVVEATDRWGRIASAKLG
jgi:hypothetical protein